MAEERLPTDFYWVLVREGGEQRFGLEDQDTGEVKIVEEWEGPRWEIRFREPGVEKAVAVGTIEALSPLGFKYKCNLHADLFGREEFGHRGPMDKAGRAVIAKWLDKKRERIAGMVERAMENNNLIPEIPGCTD